ncbi:hypothetical protein ACNKHK_25665 [Shigella flexneri]
MTEKACWRQPKIIAKGEEYSGKMKKIQDGKKKKLRYAKQTAWQIKTNHATDCFSLICCNASSGLIL